jgi:diacylglycerol kinase family enzyme
MTSEPRGSPRAVDLRAPFLIVMNVASGHDDAGKDGEIIERTLTAAGREARLMPVERPERLVHVARDTVHEAQRTGGTVVVAGGDGTINTVVNAVYGSGCNLGVIPQGTFNMFGRTHGIPEDTAAAAAALLTSRAHPVQAGLVNDRVFVVNASLGLYPEILQDRERFKRELGRRRWVGIAAALATLLRHEGELRLSVEHRGEDRLVRTRTLFVGNNALQLSRVGIHEAPLVEAGMLVGLMLRPVGTLSLLSLFLRGAIGTLGDAEQVISFPFTRLAVRPKRRSTALKVAADGEVFSLKPPIEFRVAPEPLWLIKPDVRAAQESSS